MSNRRRHTNEFKARAVKLVTEQGYSIGEAARRLDVGRKSLHDWIGKFAPHFNDADAAKDTPTDPKAFEAELRRLRKDNEKLRMEREILKKATAFFAKEQP
jgi:transposase